MAVLSSDVRFTYWEYQALMLALAGTMLLGLVAIELMMKRYQVLPLLFPGMFTIRERRLYFFDRDVGDVAIAKQLRGQAKLLVRIVLFVTLSYIWQNCVLDTDQTFGVEFPSQQCNRGMDCFAAEIHIRTFFTRKYDPVCNSEEQIPFEKRTLVSCIAVVPPTATNWLMHLGISYSITLFNFNVYSVLVWVIGKSRLARRTVFALTLLSSLGFLFMTFGVSVFGEAPLSWLSVLMSIWVPTFLYTSWRTGRLLQSIWDDEAQKVQSSIEEHLNLALSDFEPESAETADNCLGQEPRDLQRPPRRYIGRNPVAIGAESFLKAAAGLQDKVDRHMYRGRTYSQEFAKTPVDTGRGSFDGRPSAV